VPEIKDGNVIVAGEFPLMENSPQNELLDNEWINTYRKGIPYLLGLTW
jgi:hypothetical protein